MSNHYLYFLSGVYHLSNRNSIVSYFFHFLTIISEFLLNVADFSPSWASDLATFLQMRDDVVVSALAKTNKLRTCQF